MKITKPIKPMKMNKKEKSEKIELAKQHISLAEDVILEEANDTDDSDEERKEHLKDAEFCLEKAEAELDCE